jgi:MarR family transcriptional regulator for hemolysin
LTKTEHIDEFLPLGKHLSIVTKLYVGVLTKNLGHLVVERHFSILILIEKNKGKCTQQYLSDALYIDKASMVRIIDDFVKKNILKRTVNPSDRREHWIELTSKGKKTVPEIIKGVKDLNATALKGLSKKQTNDFFATLKAIGNNLKDIPANRVILNYKAKQ